MIEPGKDSADWASVRLRDDQLEAFDTEYVSNRRWPIVERCLKAHFPDGRFSFLDIGGGNGVFADRVLDNYPEASAAVLDNSDKLLARNRPDSRKVLIHASASDLEHVVDRCYDVIFFNWVLHHLLGSSYATTLQNMRLALSDAVSFLTERGRVSVFENMYDGLVVDGLPSRLIYTLTSSRRLAPFTRRMGANTAGVGVCFLSRRAWGAQFERAALRVERYSDDARWQVAIHRRVFLHLGNIRCGHFWLAPDREPDRSG
jgi:ubiquinone/menaquinone biosynthesis C-methylase UbiE